MGNLEIQPEDYRGPEIKTPEEIRDFFNSGGIAQIAEPLDYLLEGSVFNHEGKVIITDDNDDGELSAGWHDKGPYRLLMIRSNLARLAGLSLTISTKHGVYETGGSDMIAASHSAKLETGHRVGHFLMRGAAFPVGDPMVALKVHQIVKWELQEAATVLPVSRVTVN